jgi:GTP-binding protein EngB required for normal cell division
MLRGLEQAGRDIVIVANKVDKIPKSKYQHQLKLLRQQLPGHLLFPYSSNTKVGRDDLMSALLS